MSRTNIRFPINQEFHVTFIVYLPNCALTEFTFERNEIGMGAFLVSHHKSPAKKFLKFCPNEYIYLASLSQPIGIILC